MAGHSKWKNIQHRKGAQDARKGRAFTKIIKEITVAVKVTTNPDPDTNPRLRAAILNAKAINMPKDNIERAIKKAMGEDGSVIQEINYEGYASGGVAVFIECATDNPTRTVSNIRSYFNKHGGSLGKDGCLQFVFTRKAIFSLPQGDINEDDFTMSMIDAGAEDVEFEEGMITVTAAMEDFGSLQKAFAALNIEPQESGLQRLPLDTKDVDVKTYEAVMKLVDKIEEDDDVQKVYHNIEYKAEFDSL